MSPKLWYMCTKMNGVTIRKSVTLIFTAVVTLKCCVVLLFFFFPAILTQSVYTQHGHKQKTTECYCRLRIVSGIQRKFSTGGQLVWQAWCVLKMNTQKCVSGVLC